MSNLPKAELLELFQQEVDAYIPEIRQGLATLSVDKSAQPAIQELHRLFHNIKGAASQVLLVDLSQGAKVVEAALEAVVDEGQPVSDQLLTALHRTVELLGAYSYGSGFEAAEQGAFHRQVTSLFTPGPAEGGEDRSSSMGSASHQEIRAIFPLLHQLAGCLSSDGSGNGHDRMIYAKLRHGLTVLTAAVQAAGLGRQGRLLGEFHELLGRLHALPYHPEVTGVMQDFFQFLEVVFTEDELDQGAGLERLERHLQRFAAVLGAIDRPEGQLDLVAEPLGSEHLDLLAEPMAEGMQADFLDELAEPDLDGEPWPAVLGNFDEAAPELDQSPVAADMMDQLWPAVAEVEQPSAPIEGLDDVAGPDRQDEREEEETFDEDQQLLMEIFREECDEHLIVINRVLNELEAGIKGPGELTSALKGELSTMRRAVHTLKGAASMTGVNLLAKGAHSLEDLLDWLHDEATEISPQEVQLIATGIDVIELLSQSPGARTSASLDRLVEAIDGYLAAGTVAGAAEESEQSIAEEFTGDPGVAADHPAPGEAVQEPEPAQLPDGPAALPGDASTLRVRLDDLDELVGIEGELVVARGAMEQLVGEFHRTLEELDKVRDNLRRKAQELETGFEVQALYGFSPVSRYGAELPAEGEMADFDPIELDRYSQLNLIIRSLNEISVDVSSIHSTLNSLARDIGGQIGKQQLTMRLMQDKLMRIRMTPLSSISRILFRTVRDTAKKLGKKVTLTIVGEDVYMDRFVWARITDPLMHILRNGVDHGIESPEVRAAAGKPETGTIHLQAEQRSRYAVLRISDDGGGVNTARIRDKLRRDGLVRNVEALTDQELLEFLFHPSFTTRDNVTTISGRGVGLDVVRRNIQELRGSVQIRTTPGQGVVFEIHIPFTLSVNRAAMVSVAGRPFAIPLQDILQVKHFSARELEKSPELTLKFGELEVPVVNLGHYLQHQQKITIYAARPERLLTILFIKDEQRYAVAIDAISEQREIIVKNLGSHLTHVRGISGVTLTGSGGLIPIVNLRELVAVERQEPTIGQPVSPPVNLNEPLKVLIVDDSISVRHSVARLVESQSWVQQQAVDGLDALAKLEGFLPDVIVLDIEMPRMNGYEFKSSLNNQEQYRDIPVVMLTSRVSEKHQQKARELGIDHYLTKPYQDEVFVGLLEKIRSTF